MNDVTLLVPAVFGSGRTRASPHAKFQHTVIIMSRLTAEITPRLII